MGRETNIHLLQALEKQIEEGKGDIIKLKRTRNSLLNISIRAPPEILGCIFSRSVAREAAHPVHSRDFAGLRKGSYNFLLVCHHWFEVASRTPELWSFWGNTLQDWKKRHHSCGATPLDLVLHGNQCDPGVRFDESLQYAVRSRVMQDTIRQVHLTSNDCDILNTVISSLTPNDNGGQNDNIESIIWRNGGYTFVDPSNFFARSRLSRLRSLDLYGLFWVSSWDRLASRTTLLTTLSLDFHPFPSSPAPTASQLFSILASNPNLRRLTLSNSLPHNTDGSTFRIPLHNLKALCLVGKFCHLSGLLHRLILPGILDRVDLMGTGSTVEDVLQTLGPYMRDYFRCDAGFQDTLEASTPSSSSGSAAIFVTVVYGETTRLELESQGTSFKVQLANRPPPDVLEQLLIDVIALVPKERVEYFNAELNTKLPEELLLMMPNIKVLHAVGAELSEGFLQPNPDGPYANAKLLPSLKTLYLDDVILKGGDWSYLTTYLAHQTSDGQIISLEMFGEFPYMCPEVVNEIKDMVGRFTYYQLE